jgi:pseudouridine-5'-phosphate glycosidase
MSSPDPIEIRPAVAAALKSDRPVVALATTGLSHTLPWPANREALQAAEEAVRQEGAVLAAIGVCKGRIVVGLEAAELESLSRERHPHRISRRDLPASVLAGWNGGVTVSAMMQVAKRVGIRIGATASIGTARSIPDGESRYWDVSSDIVELSRTPVAVVCCGARSASQPCYTAEVLDTYRVPLLGFRTNVFPAFYMTVGDASVSSRLDTAAEAARFLDLHWSLDGAGVVVAQTTPAASAISPDELLPALRSVEEQAAKDRVTRRDFSPFLMDKLNRLTGGKALRAYQAILIANARLGAQIAAAMSAANQNHKPAVRV